MGRTKSCTKKFEVNWGSSWKEKILFIKAEAISAAESTLEKGIKWPTLTMNNEILVKPLESRRSVIKFIEIESQGLYGISSGLRRP